MGFAFGPLRKNQRCRTLTAQDSPCIRRYCRIQPALEANETSLLIGNRNLHYVNNSGVGINVYDNRYVLTFMTF